MGIFDTSIESIRFSFFPVSDYFYEGLHVREFFKVAEQFKQEQAHRIIGESKDLVFMGDNRSNKGEIYQGSDKSGKPFPPGGTIGMDFDGIFVDMNTLIARSTLVWPPARRAYGSERKRTIVLGVDLNMNTVELFDNAAYAEGSEVSQSTVPLLRVSDIKRSFLKKNPVW